MRLGLKEVVRMKLWLCGIKDTVKVKKGLKIVQLRKRPWRKKAVRDAVITNRRLVNRLNGCI